MAAVLLCTDPFLPKAGIEARDGGLPDLRRLTMPHSIDPSERDAVARRIAAEALDALTAEGGTR